MRAKRARRTDGRAARPRAKTANKSKRRTLMRGLRARAKTKGGEQGLKPEGVRLRARAQGEVGGQGLRARAERVLRFLWRG